MKNIYTETAIFDQWIYLNKYTYTANIIKYFSLKNIKYEEGIDVKIASAIRQGSGAKITYKFQFLY